MNGRRAWGIVNLAGRDLHGALARRTRGNLVNGGCSVRFRSYQSHAPILCGK